MLKKLLTTLLLANLLFISGCTYYDPYKIVTEKVCKNGICKDVEKKVVKERYAHLSEKELDKQMSLHINVWGYSTSAVFLGTLAGIGKYIGKKASYIVFLGVPGVIVVLGTVIVPLTIEAVEYIKGKPAK